MASHAPAAALVDLGLTDYAAAHALQLTLVEKRRGGHLAEDLFLVTEHPATFTLGRRGGRQNLMVAEEFLRAKNIPLVQIERGGDITYHGPGQLVVYPILNLRQAGLSVSAYVHCLEEVMLRLAAMSGVAASRDPRNHGVWISDRKLGSVGIAIRHGVTFHGLALNVNPDLTPFSWVNPCGLTGVRMTTLSRESGGEVSLDTVKKSLTTLLPQIFDRPFAHHPKEYLNDCMSRQATDRQTQMAAPQPADRAGI